MIGIKPASLPNLKILYANFFSLSRPIAFDVLPGKMLQHIIFFIMKKWEDWQRNTKQNPLLQNQKGNNLV